MDNVIVAYTLPEAIADGVLYPIGQVGTLPLTATRGIYHDLPMTELENIAHDFVTWQSLVEPTLPEEDRMFIFEASNGKKIWVIDDGSAVTILYPEDY